MKIAFFSRWMIEDYSPKKDNFYLISIRDPNQEVKLQEGWKKVLKIECHDLNPEKFVGREGIKYKFFEKEDAKNILNFIEKIEKESVIIIHCEAGVSRSGAVAKFLMEKFEVKNKQNIEGYNKFIYKTLKELNEKI